MTDHDAIDVLVIGPEWPTRALLRAQLIEEGFNTVAFDAWPPPRAVLVREVRPKLVIIDLRGIPHPEATLDEVRPLFGVDRVIVIASLGSIPRETLRESGVHVIERPASVHEIIGVTRSLLET